MSLLSISRSSSIFYLRSQCCILSLQKQYSKKLSNFNKRNSLNSNSNSLRNKLSLTYNVEFQRHMAGHSKWQNIKHIKADKDRQKTLLCTKYVRLIQFAVRENGPDPKFNNKLASLLEQAKKNNVSKDTLASALKRGGGKNFKFGTMEILAPGGCMVVLEYESNNESISRHEIKAICKKYSSNILSGEGGRWRAYFEKKGIITVVKELNSEHLDESKAEDSAIEAGAEEVHVKENEEGNKILEFVCAPDDLHLVKKELEKLYEVEEHYVGYIPLNKVKLNEEDMNLVDGFLEELGSVSDVVRIYENVE